MGVYFNKKSLSFLDPSRWKLILPDDRRTNKKSPWKAKFSQKWPENRQNITKKGISPQNSLSFLEILKKNDLSYRPSPLTILRWSQLWAHCRLPARRQVLMAVLGQAGKFEARMKSQSGDDLIVSTSESSSQLNAPVSINFNKKIILIIIMAWSGLAWPGLAWMWNYPLRRTGDTVHWKTEMTEK